MDNEYDDVVFNLLIMSSFCQCLMIGKQGPVAPAINKQRWNHTEMLGWKINVCDKIKLPHSVLACGRKGKKCDHVHDMKERLIVCKCMFLNLIWIQFI